VRSATGRTEKAPTERAGRRRVQSTPATRGFTLIEVLVVVVIAAILASLMVLRLGAWRSGAEPVEQLERLAALIDFQCEQALFQSKPRGIRLTSEGYDFWQPTGQGWVPVPDDEVSRARAWQGAVVLDLVVEDRAVALDESPSSPQLICQPLGELTAFDLELRSGALTAAIAGEPGGGLAVEEVR